MKTKTKPKNTTTGKTKNRGAPTIRKKVVLAHAIHPVLRHFRLIEHRHTGKLIHFRNTSHIALIAILVFVGFFLYVSEGIVKAESSNDSILIGAIVPGPAPTVGATITSPVDGFNLVDRMIIDVVGTCFKNTFVVIKSNNQIVGSTMCTDAGIFNLQVQLQSGKNILSAINYDNLNQPGPETSLIVVNVKITNKTPTGILVVAPKMPDNPSIVPSVDSSFSDCNDYRVGSLPTGGEPHVAIVCVPRLFMPKIQQTMGILVWGGSPPYAVSIDFGYGLENDDLSLYKNALLSIQSPGYKTVRFSYAAPNTYKIVLKLTDKNGIEAIVQTSVQVNGEIKTPMAALTDDIISTSWLKTPVPLYLLAVAITLGFWGGDIFDRKFGVSKFRSRTKRTS